MNLDTAQQALKQYFGYDTFRPLQAEVIEAVLNKEDAIVLMPTGGGKSVCYQIPALIHKGLCLVISPLIALMKDQVEGLRANGIAAEFLNSTLSYSQQEAILQDAIAGNLQLLYVSPEKVLADDFMGMMGRLDIALFAVDEAHCISQWGHDFRMEYTRLYVLKQMFADVPMLALTATADRLTRKDIAQQLRLRSPRTFISSFDRPNLSLTVLPGRNRFRVILDFVRLRPNQSGIIYCLSRKGTEDLAKKLRDNGVPAAHYHAGLSPAQRSEVQEKFIEDDVPIICATIAFGMGIDKSNIRWVIHYNLPKNIEGYYQEIGRAGRDGLKSDTVLFYSFSDVMRLRSFIEDSGQPELQLAKLERMQQYADAQMCRRKLLLNYFGETMASDCGNCDVCQSPPERFDGTILAQKALSAIHRLKEQVGMGMLIDVLRGSARKEVLEKGYDQIKTYGAGSDMSTAEWQECLLQFLNLGLIEIAYDAGHVVKLAPASRGILFGSERVEMVRMADVRKRSADRLERTRPKSKKEQFAANLFERLRVRRKDLADKAGIPPYLIFTDATLEEMCRHLPTNARKMRDISGIGDRKMEQFGEIFIQEILGFIRLEEEKGEQGLRLRENTYLVTFEYYRRGDAVDQIAMRRNLHESTIYTHFARLYEDGYEVELESFVTVEEVEQVRKAIEIVGHRDRAKVLFDFLKGTVPFYKIRLAIALLNRQNAEAS